MRVGVDQSFVGPAALLLIVTFWIARAGRCAS